MDNIHNNKFWLTLATILVCCISIPVLVSAQEISFIAEAPNVVRTGQQFQLMYSLNGDVDEFTPPNFGEFKYLGGPRKNESTEINMINGRTTRTSSYTFIYYIQAPAKEGKYTINPAIAKYKRNEIKSNSLEIEVKSGGTSNQSASGNNDSQSGSNASSGGENVYVRLECDKNSAYVGEQITAWIKLYTQAQISGIDQQAKGPEFVGFYQQDVELPALNSLTAEKVGNDVYYTGVLKKVILYPQKSGEIVIEPFDLVVEIQKQTRRRSQSIFDEIFGPQFERSRVSLTSNRLNFSIKPLPGNQPVGFTGAVGRFQINGKANLTQVKVNDAITFTVTISGKGNLKLIDKVISEFPPAFEVFDPVRNAQLDKNNQNKSGKISFEYTAIPRHPGNYTIPAFSLVYFDPETKKYNTISTQSFDITVDKGEGDSLTIVAGNLSKEDIEMLGSDIRYIETKTKLHPQSSFLFGSLGFYLIYLLFIVGFIVILVIRKERIKHSADVARYKNRRAGRIANKRLKKAYKLLKTNNKEEFYDELEQALWNYLSDKLKIPFAELSKERAVEELKSRNIDETLTHNFLDLIKTCEIARYAPGGLKSERSDLLTQSAKILNNLDQNL